MEKKGQAMGSAVIAVVASAIVGIIGLVVYAGVLNANKTAINSASVLWLVLTYVPVFIGLDKLSPIKTNLYAGNSERSMLGSFTGDSEMITENASQTDNQQGRHLFEMNPQRLHDWAAIRQHDIVCSA